MANIRREFGDDLTLKNGKLGINTTTAQERVDVVGIVKVRDLNVTGVSSLTAYEGFLRADNQIDESINLEFGNGLKASLSGEIIVGTGVTVTIGIVGLGTTSVGVGTTTALKTASLDTTDVNLAGGSQVECLKVFNTFTPPSGGTNERPYKPKPGQLYYNYDFKTIEFHDGNGWRQVDNTTRSGRAIYGGTSNNPYYQVLHYVNIHTTGNSIDFGSLIVQRYGTTGSCSSNTRALVAGGYHPTTLDVMEYFTMASGGTAIDFGNLAQAEYTLLSCSSSTRGLFTGSYLPSASSADSRHIQYVEIGTTGNALEFGDMSGVTRFGGAGLSSPTRGIFAGGRAKNNASPYSANAATHEIDLVTIASKGNSIDFGNMTFNGGYCGGISNTTRGIIGGSRTPAAVNNIDMITIATTGNAVHFGDLTVARAGSQTGSTQTRGVFIGGSPTADTRKTIDYITISSSGNAIDFGESGIEIDVGASVSDSHGGLGGF